MAIRSASEMSDRDLAEALVRLVASGERKPPDKRSQDQKESGPKSAEAAALSPLLQTVWWLRQPPR